MATDEMTVLANEVEFFGSGSIELSSDRVDAVVDTASTVAQTLTTTTTASAGVKVTDDLQLFAGESATMEAQNVKVDATNSITVQAAEDIVTRSEAMAIDVHTSLSVTADHVAVNNAGSLNVAAGDNMTFVGNKVVGRAEDSVDMLVGGGASISGGTVDVQVTGELSVQSAAMSMASDGVSHKLTSSEDAIVSVEKFQLGVDAKMDVAAGHVEGLQWHQ